MGRNDNLVAGILFGLIIVIFLLTVYFCLDIFGIIKVPQQLSLAHLFASNVSVSVAESFEEKVTEDNIDEWINGKTGENNDENNTDENASQEGNSNATDIPAVTPPDFFGTGNDYNSTEDLDGDSVSSSSSNSNQVVNRMYYSQLDIYGKMIYAEFRTHKEDLKTGTYVIDFDTAFNDLLHEEGGDAVLENAFQTSVNALLFDNPDIFYIDITKIYMSTEVISFGPLKTYRVKIGPAENGNYLANFFHNVDVTNLAIEGLEERRDEVKALVQGMNTYDTIKAVHDYLIENTEYDQTLSQSNIYTTYGALEGHIAVCEGYSKAYKYILDYLDIPCIIACGIAQNSNGETESHAWNYVKIDDKWYAVDVTWDDPVIVGTGRISRDVYTRYFLKGSNDFFKDHFEDGRIVEGSKFVYPTISEENY